MKTIEKKIPVSVGILTKDSGKTLLRALLSVENCAEIILCDGGSTDDTLSIAREFGCVVIQQDPQFLDTEKKINNYSGVRNQLLSLSTYDWFLYIDSDEAISPELAEEISSISQNSTPPSLVINVPVRTVLDGKIIKYSSNYPGYQNRLFNKKSGAYFIKKIHEKITYDKNIYTSHTISSPWYVFGAKDRTRSYLANTLQYINMEVEMGKNQSWKDYFVYTVWGNLLKSIKIFIKATLMYLRHGFRDSMPVSIEWGRMVYPLVVMYKFSLHRFKNLFS